MTTTIWLNIQVVIDIKVSLTTREEEEASFSYERKPKI